MTDRARWERLEALLDELLELAPSERRSRLDGLTGDDVDLRPEVERLLAADSAAVAGILDRGIAPLAGRILDEETQPVSATRKRVGPYRIERELGRGGMGEVLLGERADGDFQQLVALKIIREGLDRAEIVERFRHERQILARLRHPNIAALYDGGATEDGIPYFAMEFVEGLQIHHYCDEERLGVDERIELFDSVCRAVQHAHRNLVIHRDLKPSNVLVTADGTVKLLDFGIAKVVDAEADGADQTQRTGRFLTPAYAAPEQILGEPTSTASDVYSLGVLLYVLLTGHNPHGDTSRPVEMARAIVEREAPDPSSKAGRDSATETGAEIARRRGLAPAELRRKIRGDLDNILRKALQKKPEARYASAEDLRADLERYRVSLPVSARPATAGYRLRKFVRRHRVGVAAASVMAVSLVAGIAGVLWQAGVAAQERDQARAVKDFLIGMFSAADPTFESGESLTAVEIVERGAETVSDRFDSDPEIRAEITQVLGTVMARLAQYDRADTLLTAALADHRRLGDVDREAETLFELGDVARWQGRLDDAAACAEEAVDALRTRYGRDVYGVAQSLSLLGAARMLQGRYDESADAYHEAIRIVGETLGEDSEKMAEYLGSLAPTEFARGDLAACERLSRRALAIHRAEGNELGTAQILTSLGDVLDELDRADEAEGALREAVEIMRREYGEEGHPALAIAMSNLAGFLRGRGELDEAEALQREMVEMFVRHLGDDHVFVGRALNNLSLTVGERGDTEGAAELLGKSVATIRRALGEGHPALMSPLCNYGNKLADLDRLDEAAATLEEALAIGRGALAGHYQASYPLTGLANVARLNGRLQDAEAYIREAWEIRRDGLGPSHSMTVWARREHAACLDRLDRPEQAAAEFENAIRDAREGLPATQKELARALLERGLLGERTGDPAEMLVPVLQEAWEIRQEVYGEDEPATVEAREALERVARIP